MSCPYFDIDCPFCDVFGKCTAAADDTEEESPNICSTCPGRLLNI